MTNQSKFNLGLLKLNLKLKLVLLSILCLSSCVAALLLFGPFAKFLPVAIILVVPGARQVLAVSSHPLVRFLSEPQVAAVTPNGSKVYVTNLRRDSVTVIDVKTDGVISEVQVGSEPFSIVITPDKKKPPNVYVANFGTFNNPGNTVSVIDSDTDSVIKTIDVGSLPGDMDILPNGSKLYVVNIFSDSVSVVNNSVNAEDIEVIKAIPVGFFPTAIAITPNGKKAYVTNLKSDTITVVNTSDDSVLTTIAMGTGFGPAGIAITPKGDKAYVANTFNDTVSVIDTSMDKVIKNIPVGFFPLIVAVTPDGFKVLVSNAIGDSVSVISTSSDEVINKPITVGSIPIAIGITSDSKKAYIGNCNCGIATVTKPDTVSVIDVQGMMVTKKIMVGLGPLALAITPDDSKVYVPNSNSSTVSVISTETDEVTATVLVGEGPAEIAIMPDDSKIYVSNYGNPDVPRDTVFVIDPVTNTVQKEIKVGLGPTGMDITPDGKKLYVTNFGSITNPGSTVSVIDTETDTEIKKIDLIFDDSSFFGPMDVVVKPDGSRAYVSIFGPFDPLDPVFLDFAVLVIDVEAETIVDFIDLFFDSFDTGPSSLAISPDGTRLYVTNLGGGIGFESFEFPGITVSVIDTGTNTVVDTILLSEDFSLLFGPLDIVVTEDGSRAYVSMFGAILGVDFSFPGNAIAVLDLKTNTFQDEIILSDTSGDLNCFGPSGLALTPDNKRMFVAAMDLGTLDEFGFCSAEGGLSKPGNSVLVFDVDVSADLFTFVSEVEVGNRPFGIEVTNDGKRAYVANYLSGTVSVIDVSTNQVIDTVDLGLGETIFIASEN